MPLLENDRFVYTIYVREVRTNSGFSYNFELVTCVD